MSEYQIIQSVLDCRRKLEKFIPEQARESTERNSLNDSGYFSSSTVIPQAAPIDTITSNRGSLRIQTSELIEEAPSPKSYVEERHEDSPAPLEHFSYVPSSEVVIEIGRIWDEIESHIPKSDWYCEDYEPEALEVLKELLLKLRPFAENYMDQKSAENDLPVGAPTLKALEVACLMCTMRPPRSLENPSLGSEIIDAISNLIHIIKREPLLPPVECIPDLAGFPEPGGIPFWKSFHSLDPPPYEKVQKEVINEQGKSVLRTYRKFPSTCEGRRKCKYCNAFCYESIEDEEKCFLKKHFEAIERCRQNTEKFDECGNNEGAGHDELEIITESEQEPIFGGFSVSRGSDLEQKCILLRPLMSLGQGFGELKLVTEYLSQVRLGQTILAEIKSLLTQDEQIKLRDMYLQVFGRLENFISVRKSRSKKDSVMRADWAKEEGIIYAVQKDLLAIHKQVPWIDIDKINRLARTPCKYLNSPDGCRWGAGCKFSHDYKGKGCIYDETGRECPKKDECGFVHQFMEANKKVSRNKKIRCRNLVQGRIADLIMISFTVNLLYHSQCQMSRKIQL